MSRLLLPEVSTLPISALAELRDKLSGVLVPMRAEILRFIDELRKAVGDEPEQSALQAEADILVAVRVEPVVREAAVRTREPIDQKCRKLYTGAAKAFGLAGAALVDTDRPVCPDRPVSNQFGAAVTLLENLLTGQDAARLSIRQAVRRCCRGSTGL
ncbi:MAG: hypothetical protein ABSG03_11975 [Bryobacteraceae bacterium]